jgi:CheY-like chemotaxis protein
MEQPTILVANPRDCERKLLAHLLEHEGFRVHEAGNGVDTVRIAQAKRVDVVLLETALWQTGEMNALSSLKLHPRTRSIPVVLYGEPRHQEDLKDGSKAGAVEWIVRDASVVEKLLNGLRTILEHPVAGGPPAAAEDGAGESRTVPGSGHLTAAKVAEALDGVEQLKAYEFTVMEAITTTCTVERAEDHITEIALRDPMLLLGLLGEARRRAPGDMPGGVSGPLQAARLVGPKGFYVIAESVLPVKERCVQGWHPGQFWVHSVATARFAEILARRLDLGVPSEAAAVGLLHGIGHYVLAHYFRPLYTRLVEAAPTCHLPGNAWEQSLIGAHHGEIARWVFQQFGLPEVFEDVVVSLHEPTLDRQALKVSSRVLSLVVQAAHQLAHSLFPGDVPLGLLGRMPNEFEAALRHARLSMETVTAEARRMMAELTTEMAYLFPTAARCSCLYQRKPLGRLLYFTPLHRECDVIRTYFEARASHVELLNRPGSVIRSPGATPMVVNLTEVETLLGQVEVLTSLVAAGCLRKRRSVVLLPGPANAAHEKFTTDDLRLVCVPTYPATWLPWLASVQTPQQPAAASALQSA